MGEPTAPGAATLDISKTQIETVAGSADEIAGQVSGTTATVKTAADNASAAVPGWECAAYINGVAIQWRGKVEALTIGADGIGEFAGSLRQFVADVTVVDKKNATGLETDAGVNAEFGDEYTPSAPPDVMHRLTHGTPMPGGR